MLRWLRENTLSFNLGGLLEQYVSGAAGANQVADHFHQVAENAPADAVSEGLATAFRSDQTPPFADMVAQLFSHGDPQQRAGMLSQLLGSLGPAAMAALNSSGALAGLTGQGANPAAGTVTPDAASQVTPDQVKAIADHAEQHNPGIVDQMSGFYAQHPGLVKTLGGAALAIAMKKIAEVTRT